MVNLNIREQSIIKAQYESKVYRLDNKQSIHGDYGTEVEMMPASYSKFPKETRPSEMQLPIGTLPNELQANGSALKWRDEYIEVRISPEKAENQRHTWPSSAVGLQVSEIHPNSRSLTEFQNIKMICPALKC